MLDFRNAFFPVQGEKQNYPTYQSYLPPKTSYNTTQGGTNVFQPYLRMDESKNPTRSYDTQGRPHDVLSNYRIGSNSGKPPTSILDNFLQNGAHPEKSYEKPHHIYNVEDFQVDPNPGDYAIGTATDRNGYKEDFGGNYGTNLSKETLNLPEKPSMGDFNSMGGIDKDYSRNEFLSQFNPVSSGTKQKQHQEHYMPMRDLLADDQQRKSQREVAPSGRASVGAYGSYRDPEVGKMPGKVSKKHEGLGLPVRGSVPLNEIQLDENRSGRFNPVIDPRFNVQDQPYGPNLGINQPGPFEISNTPFRRNRFRPGGGAGAGLGIPLGNIHHPSGPNENLQGYFGHFPRGRRGSSAAAFLQDQLPEPHLSIHQLDIENQIHSRDAEIDLPVGVSLFKHGFHPYEPKYIPYKSMKSKPTEPEIGGPLLMPMNMQGSLYRKLQGYQQDLMARGSEREQIKRPSSVAGTYKEQQKATRAGFNPRYEGNDDTPKQNEPEKPVQRSSYNPTTQELKAKYAGLFNQTGRPSEKLERTRMPVRSENKELLREEKVEPAQVQKEGKKGYTFQNKQFDSIWSRSRAGDR